MDSKYSALAFVAEHGPFGSAAAAQVSALDFAHCLPVLDAAVAAVADATTAAVDTVVEPAVDVLDRLWVVLEGYAIPVPDIVAADVLRAAYAVADCAGFAIGLDATNLDPRFLPLRAAHNRARDLHLEDSERGHIAAETFLSKSFFGFPLVFFAQKLRTLVEKKFAVRLDLPILRRFGNLVFWFAAKILRS